MIEAPREEVAPEWQQMATVGPVVATWPDTIELGLYGGKDVIDDVICQAKQWKSRAKINFFF